MRIDRTMLCDHLAHQLQPFFPSNSTPFRPHILIPLQRPNPGPRRERAPAAGNAAPPGCLIRDAPQLAPASGAGEHAHVRTYSRTPNRGRQTMPCTNNRLISKQNRYYNDVVESSGVEVQNLLLPFPCMVRAGEDSLLNLLCELYERTGKTWLFELEIVPLILDFKWCVSRMMMMTAGVLVDRLCGSTPPPTKRYPQTTTGRASAARSTRPC